MGMMFLGRVVLLIFIYVVIRVCCVLGLMMLLLVRFLFCWKFLIVCELMVCLWWKSIVLSIVWFFILF